VDILDISSEAPLGAVMVCSKTPQHQGMSTAPSLAGRATRSTTSAC